MIAFRPIRPERECFVHLWRCRLDLSPTIEPLLRSVLETAECERADRFHRSQDRLSWIVSRSALRVVLAQYMGQDPAMIRFTSNAYGKPALAPDARIRFNLAHTDGLALIAVTRDQEIGVDLELVSPTFDFTEIVDHIFTPGERAQLSALPDEQRRAGFYHGWTRKEAFIKAVGEGVSFGLDCVTVSLDPEQAPRLLAIRRPDFAATEWSLYDLDLGPGYVGTLALQGETSAIESWELATDTLTEVARLHQARLGRRRCFTL
jgi:4'-phosphopantetheinyl transferase